MVTYWDKYPQIQENLSEVKQCINQQLKIQNQPIREALIRFSESGGKLLRPAFFLLFSYLGTQENLEHQRRIKMASSLEILHMASLIHDDIIDDSPLRRNTITVQAQFGKDIAVYTGDLLFTEFFNLLIETMTEKRFLELNAKTMKALLLGELNQMHFRFNQKADINAYFRSIKGKTAELFSLACLEGCAFAKMDAEAQFTAQRIGRNVGMAFQIYDDILDYVGNTKIIKKPILEDLAQGIYTLPLLVVLKTHPEAVSPLLNKGHRLTTQDAEKIAQSVIEFGGIDNAKQIARALTDNALRLLEKFPESSAKSDLKQLINDLLIRPY
ncbi:MULTISPECIES: polyprenyl synthetase family protein [unclassified Enterococcus]|uniref:polyprenyl synthetase family protein n=1 Tax=unclassified Enterococcus TaxID=2608891 RepID=UPI00155714C8|nr:MULTISPECIES: polyprenyl synthetase family protein [unclassified Enterococcus]MBS7577363.1 polyprenyl synthetase family protein [Enterococcus sp. MMGLQ5-2]MBS7584770.1 polyprenyl synthetase family protein [Enterococcus sp. MMGLQ5-1]NPD12625.1 polyprenyl synthetase family protein [Enterococcus sp. MMGLQ5-1]NPD37197.1 polyprenyl synthetase family protein [Enterococcus sp. MMGLQ5-2]